jgi:hypothetical protein
MSRAKLRIVADLRGRVLRTFLDREVQQARFETSSGLDVLISKREVTLTSSSELDQEVLSWIHFGNSAALADGFVDTISLEFPITNWELELYGFRRAPARIGE